MSNAPNPLPEPVYTLGDVARVYGLNETTVWRWACAGRIKAEKRRVRNRRRPGTRRCLTVTVSEFERIPDVIEETYRAMQSNYREANLLKVSGWRCDLYPEEP